MSGVTNPLRAMNKIISEVTNPLIFTQLISWLALPKEMYLKDLFIELQ